MYWLPDLVFLDLETTGGTPLYDRITEIGLVRIEKGEVVERWDTLINPGIPIPTYITDLTGITNEDVENAPTFEEVAPKLYSCLQGVVMAAHNARFDYGFLKAEFNRLGAVLRQRLLCTVKLSRKLYPEHKGHSLDAIMERHGLITDARHRAMGDVQLMIDYLEVAKRELGEVSVLNEIRNLTKGPSLPHGLDGAFLDEITDSPGVYLFYGENDVPLYIGKSVSLRSRVLNHFSSDHTSAKEMIVAQATRRVEWIYTAGELGALLLEAKLIKDKRPAHNRMLRTNRKLYSIHLTENISQIPWVKLVTNEEFDPTYFEFLYGIFRSKTGAQATLRKVADEYQICPKVLGLESGKGACFSHQLKRCSGICAGKEKPQLHYLRLKQALISKQLKNWPYPGRIGIKEKHPSNNLTQVYVFDQWCHLATIEDDVQLDEALQTRSLPDFDLDIYKLLKKTLKMDRPIINFQQSSS